MSFFAVLFALVVFPVIPEKWHERMSTIGTYQEDRSAMGRVNAWHFAFNLASERPLTGGGFSAFTNDLFIRYAPDPFDVHDAHSIYFEVLGEHGFLALARHAHDDALLIVFRDQPREIAPVLRYHGGDLIGGTDREARVKHVGEQLLE